MWAMSDSKILQGIFLFQEVATSISETPPQRTSPLIPNNPQYNQNQLCGPWNSEKVNQKMIIK